MSDNPHLETQIRLTAQLEALLFVASESISVNHLARVLDISVQRVKDGLSELEEIYTTSNGTRGLRLQRHQGRVQLTTAPQITNLIEHFLGLETTTHLSSAALETLAMVAYKEPTTRPQIDAIRGVNSDAVLKTLLHYGLIEDIGRAETPGRPILYSTTPDFLQHFGIGSTDELPPLPEPQSIEADNDKETETIDNSE